MSLSEQDAAFLAGRNRPPDAPPLADETYVFYY